MRDEELDIADITGLGTESKKDWPTVRESDKAPIDMLVPGSDLHAKVLRHLLSRIDLSERAMTKFYDRWNVQEKKVQAYINLADWEQQLKVLNNKGEAPKALSVVVPYSYATMSTIVTYLIHTFCGRKPMFQVSSYKKESVRAAEMQELVLQYGADHTRLVKHLFQFLTDSQMYGVGILRTKWKTVRAKRTVRSEEPITNWFGMQTGTRKVTKKESRVVYSGNDVASIDPFQFFPDPRVPMCDVNRKGEFVFWRTFEGKHALKKAEAAGDIKWVDHVQSKLPTNKAGGGESIRSLRAAGESNPSDAINSLGISGETFYQVDQGTIELIPRELGIGAGEVPEKWVVTILNKSQIVQMAPMSNDHDMHPIVVTEPYTLGYGFGHMGLVDYLGPTQDTLSWLVNSHMDNVRTVLNNMIVVDPNMVEMQDLLKPGAGKIIRLKQSAQGMDVRSIIHQLDVRDVTSNHLRDFELFMRMGDTMSSVTDNLRGLQDSGGRKTATEVRTSGEAGASRLAAQARLISAQALVDLADQMVTNNMQYLDEEFYLDLVGQQGIETPVRITPDMLAGDFYFPINDGTLPLDRVAMLDVWKQIFMTVAGDQQLRQSFDVGKIFTYMAELGGAKNLDSFKLQMQVAPPGALEEMGNPEGQGLAPMPVMGGAPGVASDPAARIMEGML